jgi:tight adherence protein B
MEDSLENLRKRLPSHEIDLVVAAVVVAQTVGGDLSEILENIANTVRERLRVEGRVRALTAQGKLQGVVMCVMPFFVAFMFYLVAPSFVEPVFSTLTGFLLLGFIVLWELIGAFVIRAIVKIDV